ncbi:hypothetical protein GCM10009304_09490 [Pseudomonas matsuisoli]|uniref:Uncharacterized protein n=1 Tax=Pseudomonas matsuisoli TaxID=1515666 RepID=A0A917PNM4_9PSED|nr:hypothetical protein GCM10009304_09490 [Pseudomonas matsuisoli]
MLAMLDDRSNYVACEAIIVRMARAHRKLIFCPWHPRRLNGVDLRQPGAAQAQRLSSNLNLVTTLRFSKQDTHERPT